MKYRQDIDGLRGIAVLSVVLFHAGVSWLPGGFVGVDIFFVISGYLITRILLDDAATGRYSIANFYVRRTRRILPALYFVILVVLVLGFFWLLPSELQALSESVFATTLFFSNFLFWKQSGYFDAAAELQPLLHTWSLAVEEQFYLLWPLVLVVCYKRGWPMRRVIMVLIGLSFALSSLFLTDRPAAVFYLLPTRAWELLIGAWLATASVSWPINTWQRSAISVVGLGVLAASVSVLDKTMPFPGWNALYPCLGTALLILAGERALVNRLLLGWRPLVLTGLISYSLYLWHWPLLSYVRILNLGQLPSLHAAAAVALSMGLATLTWRYVESPFRRGGDGLQASTQLVRYALPGLVLCMAAWSVMYFKGFPGRVSDQVLAAQQAAKDFNTARGMCHLNMEQSTLPDISQCTTPRSGGANHKTVLVWGDSHAEAMIPGVASLSGLSEGMLLQLTKTSCPPLLGVNVVRGSRVYGECASFNTEVLRLIEAREDIRTIVLAARWPVYVLESGFGVSEEMSGAPRYALRGRNRINHVENDSHAVFGGALQLTVDALVRAGKVVVVVGAVPEMKFDVPGCIARKRMSALVMEGCDLSSGAVAARILTVNEKIEGVAKRNAIASLFPDRVLCREGRCEVVGAGGHIFYYDHNHLSTAGARYVFSKLGLQE